MVFFFKVCLPHRFLHSFPTRRSSDLLSDEPERVPFQHAELAHRLPRRCRRKGFSCAWLYRSEEHTSELQSHHDLVCRLLLEKKKKKIKETYNILRINLLKTSSVPTAT